MKVKLHVLYDSYMEDRTVDVIPFSIEPVGLAI
jgi:hypothetical protein